MKVFSAQYCAAFFNARKLTSSCTEDVRQTLPMSSSQQKPNYMLLEETKKLRNRPATLGDVEDSADSIMRSCAVQFSAIDKRFTEVDKRFDHIEERLDTMVTKTELDALYRGMINRFDAIDRRFDEQDRKFDAGERRFQAFELFMKGHEKRITKVEKHLAFA